TVLTIPYAAYTVAESVHVSGVLAVVAAGLVRGRYAPEIVSAEMRIMARSVWNILVFVLNSLVFILIGIQMSDVMEKLGRFHLFHLLLLGVVISAVAIAVRFLWVFPAAYLPRWLSGNLHENGAAPRRRELMIISWCGMRGIVSLAAALSLPTVLPNGQPFPARELIIFLSFFVIAATLVGQGLTLAPLIRKLKLGADWSMVEEQRHVRTAMSAAAIVAIDTHLARANAPQKWADQLRSEIADRVALAAPVGLEQTPKNELLLELRRVAIRAERKELLRLWRENEISDEVMRHQEEILDYQEAQF
ncbi:MAG: Na+/H+ antiporter, partial [Proteobacteria bacterium]|nr:Na+/H+ antiporter [Pseudomonadota bacterium]